MRYEIDGQRLTDIADAIRDQTGGSATIAPENMPTQIRSISGGGVLPSGGCEGQVLTIVSGEPDWADVPTELPNGGTEGQVLTKTSNGMAWQTPSGGGGLPSGGSEGQMLLSDGSGGATWADVPTELPSGGTNGQVLTKTSSGVAWQTPSGGGGLPSGGSEGQMLLSDGNDGATWGDVFPAGGSEVDGFFLSYGAQGLEWVPSPLPLVTGGDAGKVLMVNDYGQWVVATLS